MSKKRGRCWRPVESALVVLLSLCLQQHGAGPAVAMAQGTPWERVWLYTSPLNDPMPRRGHGMAVVDDNMYVYGGMGLEGETNVGLKDLWVFDLVERKWRSLNQVGNGTSLVPEARAGHTLVVEKTATPGHLDFYVFGGVEFMQGKYDNADTSKSNIMYRLHVNTHDLASPAVWSVVNTPVGGPEGRCDHYGELYTPGNGSRQLIIFGGRSVKNNLDADNRVAYSDVWSFDYDSGLWAKLADNDLDGGGTTGALGPRTRFAQSGAIFGSKLYIYGGVTFRPSGNVDVLDDIWSFSLNNKVWKKEAVEIDFRRSFHTLNVIHNQLYSFGGYVVYTNPRVAFVYNDLQVLDQDDGYWLKYIGGGEPSVRYDHRGVVWRNDSLVVYGGSFQTVMDVKDMWLLNVSHILPGDFIKAPPEEGPVVFFYDRMIFLFISLVMIITTGCCLTIRRRIMLLRQAQHNFERMQPANPGMSDGAINALPLAPYHCMSPTHIDNKDLCAICLQEYQEEESLRVLPCTHRFHPSCVDEWLHQSSTCPMCKHRVTDYDSSPSQTTEDQDTPEDDDTDDGPPPHQSVTQSVMSRGRRWYRGRVHLPSLEEVLLLGRGRGQGNQPAARSQASTHLHPLLGARGDQNQGGEMVLTFDRGFAQGGGGGAQVASSGGGATRRREGMEMTSNNSLNQGGGQSTSSSSSGSTPANMV